jgi:hypothetical protein
MAKSEGIYSPVLRTRTVGTYKSPSAGQHKAMVKAEGIKYKGLTRRQIVNKAIKSGDIKKLENMGLKVRYNKPTTGELATATAVFGGGAMAPIVASDIEKYSSKKEKRKKQRRTESRKAQRGMSSGGSIKLAKKYFRGGLV